MKRMRSNIEMISDIIDIIDYRSLYNRVQRTEGYPSQYYQYKCRLKDIKEMRRDIIMGGAKWSRGLDLREAQSLMYECIDVSNRKVLEQFWLLRMTDKVVVRCKDFNFLCDMVGKVGGGKRLSTKHVDMLVKILKRDWRQLWNRNGAVKFFMYMEELEEEEDLRLKLEKDLDTIFNRMFGAVQL
jgi:hypothetical protein